MWLNKREQSEWAFEICTELKNRNLEDVEEIWKLIDDQEIAYYYCLYIKDRKELWSKITNKYIAHDYCRSVKERPEVRKYIKIN